MDAPSSLNRSSTPTEATSSDMSDSAKSFPTASELANLDDARLLATLSDISNRLNIRLARYKTGAGWQRYLRLPEAIFTQSGLSSQENREALPIQQEKIRETLARFERVASNTDFRIVTSQPGFVATLAALREVTNRWDHGNTVAPTTSSVATGEQEVLPTPAPAPRQAAPTGEHSILKR